MVKQSEACESHYHAMSIACGDDLAVGNRSEGLRNKFHTKPRSMVNGVPEREECVGGYRYIGESSHICNTPTMCTSKSVPNSCASFFPWGHMRIRMRPPALTRPSVLSEKTLLHTKTNALPPPDTIGVSARGSLCKSSLRRCPSGPAPPRCYRPGSPMGGGGGGLVL